MAQNKLDFYIASHVQGMGELAQLTASVKRLEGELKRLQSTNTTVAASTNGVIVAGRRYNTMADAQSRALRQQRQGMQQVGMQINDFATSVSTGASVTQAFNQQIGQLGYAMSMMQGRAGAVGRFLAGPWGAAVTIAVMGLGMLYDRFTQAGDGAEDLMKELKSVQYATSEVDSYQRLAAVALGIVTKKMGEQTVAARNLARAKLQLAIVEAQLALAEGRKTLAGAAARTVPVRTPAPTGGVKGVFGADALGMAGRAGGIKDVPTMAAALVKQFNAGIISAQQFNDRLFELHQTGKTTTKTFTELNPVVANMGVQQENLAMATKALDDVMTGNTAAVAGYAAVVGDGPKGATTATDGLGGAVEEVVKELSAFERQVESLTATVVALTDVTEGAASSIISEFLKIGAAQQKLTDVIATGRVLVDQGAISFWEYYSAVKAARQEVEKLQKASDLIVGDKPTSSLNDLPAILKDKVPAVDQSGFEKMNERLIEQAKALQDAYASVGNAVSEAFKGMLTGARSWKDGLRGIIQSVIDQLWELYVVQQIVGFITKALGSIGGPAPNIGANANGTQNWGGGLSWVGERGPELVQLPKGSKVIPAHRAQNMGGGGMTINVDARGSSDPEAVRRQVQQGIIEAAPQIIQASTASTISALRRPRLGGGMQ